MWLPRVRFTLRRMMVAVAAVAVALWAEKGVERWAEYWEQAERHEGRLGTLSLIRQEGYYPYCSIWLDGIPRVFNSKTAPLHGELVRHHTRSLRKYRLAMWRPWVPVEPESPPPNL